MCGIFPPRMNVLMQRKEGKGGEGGRETASRASWEGSSGKQTPGLCLDMDVSARLCVTMTTPGSTVTQCKPIFIPDLAFVVLSCIGVTPVGSGRAILQRTV